MSQRIFIAEDDDSIRELVAYALESAGFQIVGFSDGAEFMKRISGDIPDLALLDIMMPKKDGMTILRELRSSAKTEKLPVIMMTAKGAEYDRIKGLDSGADDYITKPFSVMELVSRVKAVLRRIAATGSDSVEYCVGGLVLNDEKRSATANGKEMNLTYKEFELLRLLMQNAGRVLDRDKILNTVWGYDYDGENRTVDMHIKTLRQKAGECGERIKTVRNVGYKVE
jgi:two-component system alkaline phosphatase synthesis response regulator PhoP